MEVAVRVDGPSVRGFVRGHGKYAFYDLEKGVARHAY